MKRVSNFSMVLILFVAALSFGLDTVKAQEGAKIAGSWDFTVESPQGTFPSLLVITQEGDKLTGAMKSTRGERALDKVAINGDDVTLAITIQFQGSDMVITYTGKLDGDSMKGEADFGGLATGDWSAVRHKGDMAASASAPATGATSAAANISGVWAFTVQTQMGTGTPTFTFEQKGEELTGKYSGQLGEAPLKGMIKGTDVNFSIKVNVQGENLEVTYTGKVEGSDQMKGTAKFGGLGEGTWTAKRK